MIFLKAVAILIGLCVASFLGIALYMAWIDYKADHERYDRRMGPKK